MISFDERQTHTNQTRGRNLLCKLACVLVILLVHTKDNDRSGLAITAPSRISSTSNNGEIVAIKEGANLDLSCPIVVPDEDMIISWTCENEPANIRSSRIHVTDSGKLRIHSAKVGDSCNYRCEAANGFGTLSVVIKVIIVDRYLVDQMARRVAGNHSAVQNIDPSQHLADRILTTVRPVVVNRPSEPVALRSDLPKLETSRSQQMIDNSSEIEMQIEPTSISVARNLTFSLECRIKYAPHLVVPQIIWLKEFMGPKPNSVNEALEQNLVLLDNIYYHSLNWPRSVTHSDKSRAASSALLIRQSNYVHSGRYVCLAGYPTAIMNLQLNKSSIQPALVATNESSQTKSPLKYKLVQAVVEVDDEEAKKTNKQTNKNDKTKYNNNDDRPSKQLGEQVDAIDREPDQQS